MKSFIFLLSAFLCFSGCYQNQENVVNVYTHRHYQSDEEIYKQFTKETGIKVNVIKSAADQLINRLEMEGKNTPADILITVDAGRLWRAKEKNLLQPFESAIIINNIPAFLRDKEKSWFAFSYRCRAIIYNKEHVQPSQFSTYEALTDSIWKGKFLTRSSSSEYNQSLMASLIAHNGIEAAEKWSAGMVKNFAREPKGNDTENMMEVTSGKGDFTLANTYYLAKMFNSDITAERESAERAGVFFPNQNDRGTHINISGAALVKHAKHKANAVKLLEFLTETFAQQTLTEMNFEYPANPKVEMCKTLASFGNFKADTLDLSLLGKYNADAVKVFDRTGWY
jgi:iron(III) transport system substrate-binding protein